MFESNLQRPITIVLLPAPDEVPCTIMILALVTIKPLKCFHQLQVFPVRLDRHPDVSRAHTRKCAAIPDKHPGLFQQCIPEMRRISALKVN
jgi:hypothetical protein